VSALHPIEDAEEVADALKASTWESLVAEVARRGRVAADLARWCVLEGSHSNDHRRLTELAMQAGQHAAKARDAFGACRAMAPNSLETREALNAARESAQDYLTIRVHVAVAGAKAGSVRAVVQS
jgi:CO dehydrogenase/acetyl-CoA synthase alpha subunit